MYMQPRSWGENFFEQPATCSRRSSITGKVDRVGFEPTTSAQELPRQISLPPF